MGSRRSTLPLCLASSRTLGLPLAGRSDDSPVALGPDSGAANPIPVDDPDVVSLPPPRFRRGDVGGSGAVNPSD